MYKDLNKRIRVTKFALLSCQKFILTSPMKIFLSCISSLERKSLMCQS